MDTSFVTHPFPPLFDAHSRVLVLGTMPSPASRARGFFYMHAQNRFWRVLAAVFGEPLRYRNDGTPFSGALPGADSRADPAAAIAERRALALNHGVALWDVLAGCAIAGAADSSIRDAAPNDFSALLAAAPIARVFCTGKAAFTLYGRHCAARTGIPAVCLPSTSSANASWSFDALCAQYAQLREIP